MMIPIAGNGRVAGVSSEALRAEALFASTLQASDSPAPDHVRLAVASTLRRFGIDGCGARMAAEFGDHPELAAARMSWALATVRTSYGETGRTPLAARPGLLAGSRT